MWVAQRPAKQLLLEFRREMRAQVATCWERCGSSNRSKGGRISSSGRVWEWEKRSSLLLGVGCLRPVAGGIINGVDFFFSLIMEWTFFFFEQWLCATLFQFHCLWWEVTCNSNQGTLVCNVSFFSHCFSRFPGYTWFSVVWLICHVPFSLHLFCLVFADLLQSLNVFSSVVEKILAIILSNIIFCPTLFFFWGTNCYPIMLAILMFSHRSLRFTFISLLSFCSLDWMISRTWLLILVVSSAVLLSGETFHFSNFIFQFLGLVLIFCSFFMVCISLLRFLSLLSWAYFPFCT